jgi:hypothetical protein
MATLLQVASFLAERAGKKTDYTFIKEMKDLAVIKRARFLANTLSKDPGKARFYLQKFKISLKKIDLTDECASSEEVAACCDEKAFRTEEKIPMPLQFGVHPFEYVGAPGGFKGYGWTTFGNEPYMKLRKPVGKNPRYAYSSDFIYIFNKDDEEIQVEGVFPDPRLLAKFKGCNGQTVCWSEEKDAFLEEQIAELIIKDIMAVELRIQFPNEPIQVKEDKNV